MTNEQAHPAAEILAEIAEEARHNPEPWRAFEAFSLSWRTPISLGDLGMYIGCGCPVRRRPRTVEINGYQVPEPVREPLAIGTGYFAADPTLKEFKSQERWGNDTGDYFWLRRGLIHLTPEAAEAHGRALVSFTSREDEG